MLSVIAHFITLLWKACTVLLALRPLYRPYSGLNMSLLIINIIKAYNLSKALRFCILNNATDNNTLLRLVEAHLLSLGII